MNKRQKKKAKIKREIFAISYCNSYSELKRLDREYHEYVVASKRIPFFRCKICLHLHTVDCDMRVHLFGDDCYERLNKERRCVNYDPLLF